MVRERYDASCGETIWRKAGPQKIRAISVHTEKQKQKVTRNIGYNQKVQMRLKLAGRGVQGQLSIPRIICGKGGAPCYNILHTDSTDLCKRRFLGLKWE